MLFSYLLPGIARRGYSNSGRGAQLGHVECAKKGFFGFSGSASSILGHTHWRARVLDDVPPAESSKLRTEHLYSCQSPQQRPDVRILYRQARPSPSRLLIRPWLNGCRLCDQAHFLPKAHEAIQHPVAQWALFSSFFCAKGFPLKSTNHNRMPFFSHGHWASGTRSVGLEYGFLLRPRCQPRMIVAFPASMPGSSVAFCSWHSYAAAFRDPSWGGLPIPPSRVSSMANGRLSSWFQGSKHPKEGSLIAGIFHKYQGCFAVWIYLTWVSRTVFL